MLSAFKIKREQKTFSLVDLYTNTYVIYLLLLVDDDVAVGESLTALLSALGCKITTAQNGADALNKMDQAQFDLILTDLKMPVLDGVELLEILDNNEHWRSIPKYATTGEVISHGDDSIRVINQHTHGVEYIQKAG